MILGVIMLFVIGLGTDMHIIPYTKIYLFIVVCSWLLILPLRHTGDYSR
jgi:hypothetical protein